MPELPDVAVYVEALEKRVLGQALERVRVASPFLVRTAVPPLRAAEGKRVLGLRRLGKRIAFCLEDELFLVLHLMIAGRLHWKEAGAKVPGRVGLAAFDFPAGTLTLTEASTKKRAALHLLQSEAGLEQLRRGGIEPLEATAEQFAGALRRESHTLKRALTDPELFAGIGNAYSDEILHRARLSPVKLTRALTDGEVARLHAATGDVMREWIDRLRAEASDGFPEKVTAFRPEMAVHGKYGRPCPVCGTPIQRQVFAENEANYCPACQTGGRLLADRALSSLLRGDWPRTLDELELRRRGAAGSAS
ncbi:MAG TPA: DNA-formamidopyrimidine glycosylase family protein [Chloroflexota bacterium]|jgi:formamidopyrimidine-DNA glycosylase|nr:DNA-formamidopyrimidine glycosylase family protein [Chloroflexota bacterium]